LVESNVQPIARVIAVDEVFGDRLTVLAAGGASPIGHLVPLFAPLAGCYVIEILDAYF